MKINEKFHNETMDPIIAEVPLDWWLERFRNWRALELAATDWTQLPDAPGNTANWATYRQQLRDLPSNKDFSNADLPTRPE